MEALLQSLAMKYGMEKAMQLLGIDEQQGNPKYAISMGGQNIDFGNMAKKGIFNKSVNAITGGSRS
jgi:NADH:ubiquinone oxidoreductase subunit B-like Fe-S oxidoreductase